MSAAEHREDLLEKAKAILLAPDSPYTCVLCREEQVYTSTARGIAPMLDFLEEGTPLAGAFAADRIVGKAAAMLFVLAEVRAVYAGVTTHAALRMLERYGIRCNFGVCTDRIINRKGDDICPMEKAVAEIEDPALGRLAIQKTRLALRAKQKEREEDTSSGEKNA